MTKRISNLIHYLFSLHNYKFYRSIGQHHIKTECNQDTFMKTPVSGSSYKTTQQSTGEFEECNAKQQLKLHILEPDFN